MNQETRLYTALKEALSQPSEAIRSQFTSQYLQQVLEETSGPMNIVGPPYAFLGYPAGPRLLQVAKILMMWPEAGQFPVTFKPLQIFSTETTSVEVARCSALTSLVTQTLADISKTRVEELVLGLGPRGLLTCLGVRETVGSVSDYSLPQIAMLEGLFNDMHTSEEERKHPHSHSILTVGARALTKHAHRSSEGFWGTVKGSEARKNEIAAELISRLTQNCVWINMHQLPGNEPVLEIRIEQGYGARWAVMGNPGFRGFLEPHTQDGHEKHWRH